MRTRSSFLLPLLLAAAPFAPGSAPVQAAGGDSEAVSTDAPGPEHYRHLWMNSPFLRPLNAAESYVLTGAARIDGKPVVTMLNTATGERFTLGTQPNPLGWRLLDLQGGTDPRHITARISIDGEEVAVRFNERQLTPDALRGGSRDTRQPSSSSPQNTRRQPPQQATPHAAQKGAPQGRHNPGSRPRRP